MIRTIVVPLDGSEFAERALGPATVLASRLDTGLRFVTTRWGDDAVAPARYLEEVASRVEVPADVVVVHDREAAEAIRVVVGEAPDSVVCMTTHGRSGLGQALLGSVAEEVLRSLDHPVLLVGPSVDASWPSAWERMLVCTDGSDASQAVLPVAADWSRALGLEPWLVQVISPEAVREAELSGANGGAAESGLLRHLAQQLGEEASWEVLHGDDPARAVVQYTRSRPFSLVAMSTHGRSGLARVTLGSVAMKVVHDCPAPVLIVRPSDLS